MRHFTILFSKKVIVFTLISFFSPSFAQVGGDRLDNPMTEKERKAADEARAAREKRKEEIWHRNHALMNTELPALETELRDLENTSVPRASEAHLVADGSCKSLTNECGTLEGKLDALSSEATFLESLSAQILDAKSYLEEVSPFLYSGFPKLFTAIRHYLSSNQDRVMSHISILLEEYENTPEDNSEVRRAIEFAIEALNDLKTLKLMSDSKEQFDSLIGSSLSSFNSSNASLDHKDTNVSAELISPLSLLLIQAAQESAGMYLNATTAFEKLNRKHQTIEAEVRLRIDFVSHSHAQATLTHQEMKPKKESACKDAEAASAELARLLTRRGDIHNRKVAIFNELQANDAEWARLDQMK